MDSAKVRDKKGKNKGFLRVFPSRSNEDNASASVGGTSYSYAKIGSMLGGDDRQSNHNDLRQTAALATDMKNDVESQTGSFKGDFFEQDRQSKFAG